MTRKEFIEKIQNQTEVPIYGNEELEERLSGWKTVVDKCIQIWYNIIKDNHRKY